MMKCKWVIIILIFSISLIIEIPAETRWFGYKNHTKITADSFIESPPGIWTIIGTASSPILVNDVLQAGQSATFNNNTDILTMTGSPVNFKTPNILGGYGTCPLFNLNEMTMNNYGKILSPYYLTLGTSKLGGFSWGCIPNTGVVDFNSIFFREGVFEIPDNMDTHPYGKVNLWYFEGTEYGVTGLRFLKDATPRICIYTPFDFRTVDGEDFNAYWSFHSTRTCYLSKNGTYSAINLISDSDCPGPVYIDVIANRSTNNVESINWKIPTGNFNISYQNGEFMQDCLISSTALLSDKNHPERNMKMTDFFAQRYTENLVCQSLDDIFIPFESGSRIKSTSARVEENGIFRISNPEFNISNAPSGTPFDSPLILNNLEFSSFPTEISITPFSPGPDKFIGDFDTLILYTGTDEVDYGFAANLRLSLPGNIVLL